MQLIINALTINITCLSANSSTHRFLDSNKNTKKCNANDAVIEKNEMKPLTLNFT